LLAIIDSIPSLKHVARGLEQTAAMAKWADEHGGRAGFSMLGKPVGKDMAY